VRISEIVEHLRAAGEQILDTDLARVSPLCYAHIIPNGTYNFEGAIQGGNPAHNIMARQQPSCEKLLALTDNRRANSYSKRVQIGGLRVIFRS